MMDGTENKSGRLLSTKRISGSSGSPTKRGPMPATCSVGSHKRDRESDSSPLMDTDSHSLKRIKLDLTSCNTNSDTLDAGNILSQISDEYGPRPRTCPRSPSSKSTHSSDDDWKQETDNSSDSSGNTHKRGKSKSTEIYLDTNELCLGLNLPDIEEKDNVADKSEDTPKESPYHAIMNDEDDVQDPEFCFKAPTYSGLDEPSSSQTLEACVDTGNKTELTESDDKSADCITSASGCQLGLAGFSVSSDASLDCDWHGSNPQVLSLVYNGSRALTDQLAVVSITQETSTDSYWDILNNQQPSVVPVDTHHHGNVADNYVSMGISTDSYWDILNNQQTSVFPVDTRSHGDVADDYVSMGTSTGFYWDVSSNPQTLVPVVPVDTRSQVNIVDDSVFMGTSTSTGFYWDMSSTGNPQTSVPVVPVDTREQNDLTDFSASLGTSTDSYWDVPGYPQIFDGRQGEANVSVCSGTGIDSYWDGPSYQQMFEVPVDTRSHGHFEDHPSTSPEKSTDPYWEGLNYLEGFELSDDAMSQGHLEDPISTSSTTSNDSHSDTQPSIEPLFIPVDTRVAGELSADALFFSGASNDFYWDPQTFEVPFYINNEYDIDVYSGIGSASNWFVAIPPEPLADHLYAGSWDGLNVYLVRNIKSENEIENEISDDPVTSKESNSPTVLELPDDTKDESEKAGDSVSHTSSNSDSDSDGSSPPQTLVVPFDTDSEGEMMDVSPRKTSPSPPRTLVHVDKKSEEHKSTVEPGLLKKHEFTVEPGSSKDSHRRVASSLSLEPIELVLSSELTMKPGTSKHAELNASRTLAVSMGLTQSLPKLPASKPTKDSDESDDKTESSTSTSSEEVSSGDGDETRFLMAHMSQEQLERYEAYKQSKFPTAKVKKVMEGICESNLPEMAVIATSALAKMYAEEVVEVALDVKKKLNDDGPVKPEHLREAYRQLRNRRNFSKPFKRYL